MMLCPTKSFSFSRRHRCGEWYVNPELVFLKWSGGILEISQEILTPSLVQNTIIQDIDTSTEDFIFYFDRIATLLVEQ
jgi:hypothetical protein